jgi:hypothetical protein
MYAVAFLLIVNIVLNHYARLRSAYRKVYKMLIKPKFRIGERVIISGADYKIVHISHNYIPYTYFCLPTVALRANILQVYFHQSEISRKTGLLKALE